MSRILPLAASALALLLLPACAPAEQTPPEPERFVARQLEAVGLTADDFGAPWALVEGDDGSGGGPGSEAIAEDPCTWVTEWLPAESEPFYTHSWRMYTTGDGGTFASDWLAAIEPDSDPAALLGELRDTMTACEPGTMDPSGTGRLTVTADIGPQIGDGSFSYRVDFTDLEGASLGFGEVHTVLCGQLWLHLSYVGVEDFVERDTLLGTLVERASALGGCAA